MLSEIADVYPAMRSRVHEHSPLALVESRARDQFILRLVLAALKVYHVEDCILALLKVV